MRNLIFFRFPKKLKNIEISKLHRIAYRISVAIHFERNLNFFRCKKKHKKSKISKLHRMTLNTSSHLLWVKFNFFRCPNGIFDFFIFFWFLKKIKFHSKWMVICILSYFVKFWNFFLFLFFSAPKKIKFRSKWVTIGILSHSVKFWNFYFFAYFYFFWHLKKLNFTQSGWPHIF